VRYQKNENYNRRNFGYFQNIQSKKLSKEELKEQIKLAKDDDQDAFQAILSHMHNYLCFLTKEFFIQGSEPQDVYQEGVIKLLNVISKYDEQKGPFISFAQASIRKHIITSINREQAKKRKVLNISFSLNDETRNPEGESVEYIDTITSSDETCGKVKSPMDLVQQDYEKFIIEKILKVLSPLEQKVFYLRFIQEMSYKEIAKELKLKKRNKKTKKTILDQKSVDNAIWRSRPKIKKVLKSIGIHCGSFSVKKKRKKKKAN